MIPPPLPGAEHARRRFFGAKNDGIGTTAFSIQDRSWTGFSSLALSIV